MRLTKAERHALRWAVRRKTFITAIELTELHDAERRVVEAEMRKRGFVRSFNLDIWKQRAHAHHHHG